MSQKTRDRGGPPNPAGTRLSDAVAHHQAGRLHDAEAGYRAVLQAQPRNADALHLLGVLALQVGQPIAAVELIGRAIQNAGTVADYHDNFGSALAAAGRHQEAVEAHGRAVRLKPDFAQARFNLGNALQALGDAGRATGAFLGALALRPDYAKAWYNLGNALRATGHAGSAVTALDRAVALAPGMVEAHTNLGDALAVLGRLDAAVAQHRAAVALRPDDATAWYNLGAALQQNNAYEEAEIAYREALRRAPGHVGALNNLGSVLKRLGRPEQAETCHRQALDLRPDFTEALYNLGNALAAQGKVKEAQGCYEEALARTPDLATASHNLALLALRHGDLERGWHGYDRRFAAHEALPDRHIAAPPWQGKPLGGGTLLIWREQGVGDEILFASCYADAIAQAGGPVVIEADPRLVPLLARSFPAATVRAESCDADGRETIEPPHCAAQVPAGSLPRFLRPELRRFPPRASWLVADAERVRAWRERVAALGPGLVVGIGWRSGLMTRERAGAYTRLEAWGPVLAVPGVRFVNLQYDECAAEIADAEARFGVRIHRWADLDLKNDLEGAAALVANLDLVISPAMSAGELAGALGVPVWRFGAVDWTQLGTAARPWFPAMRLFQPRAGETLDDVLVRIALALRRLAPPAVAAAPALAPASAATAIDPARVEALVGEAVALHRAGRLQEAEVRYHQALREQADHADALHLLGLLYHQAGLHTDALEWIGKALAVDRRFPQAFNHLGLVHQALGKDGPAQACFERAVALKPDFADALTHQGLLVQRTARIDEAERWHRRAVRLDPENAAAHANLGYVQELRGGCERALEHYRRAAALRPALPDAHNNIGTMERALGRTALGERPFERAVRIDPGFALAAWNIGLLRLAQGDLEAGWAGYDRRFQARQLQKPRRIPLPAWQGDDLAGRRLLVWCEQGLGDEILFASCYEDLAGRGGRIVFECDRRLVTLFARAFPWADVRAETVDAERNETMAQPDADLQVPAGTLARLMRRTLGAFPARTAFLRADAARQKLWRERLDALGPGLKVGIGWRSQIVTAQREAAYTRLEAWSPVLAVPGVRFVNLQYDECAAEIAAAEARFGVTIHRWPDLDLKDDLEGVAALIANLDLVIVPATASGELAGALGTPVWRLGGPDWTWLGAGARPWFPSMRPVQPRPGETLADTLGHVARELRRTAKTP
ncbi:tetratricopeptide repeat protein [Azospirillum sp.]|uniref:tetratricopeptide repeat protein n=1 Tax=Azospirillum sp. TaxID=34012 RepID=UPI002D737AC8|nr:tetratricopeptide repeat protein [Azospirillum sp.]HYD69969.1 tetratricopeptide repeat protein [Azospirillum sp.]